jgi:putative hydrolase of HD superfamily
MNDRLKKQIDFIIELDKMKALYRQTYVLNEDRKENDAEHSWHLAVMAFLLAEHANEEVNIAHVMKMVLLHDVVEIDAGDTYCYDTEANKSKAEREEKAAQRIYSILPEDQRDEYYALWRQFEERETPESRFATVLDRLQPMLLNYTKHGQAWQEHGICKEQVLARNMPYFDASDDLAELIREVIDDAADKGWLK